MITLNNIKYVRFCDEFYKTADLCNGECKKCFEGKLYNSCSKERVKKEEVILDRPLLVNWTITGKCQNSCLYCYGTDITHCRIVLDKLKIDEIISHLQYIRPKVVVISGGEPLLHPLLIYIIKRLNFCEIILDTNGIALNEEFIDTVQDKLHIRISLDSYKECINGYLRRSSVMNSTNIIIDNIRKCIKKDVAFSIQTVLTDVNYMEILEFGDYLIDLGVKLWRLLVVTPNTLKFNTYDCDNWINDAVGNIHKFALKNKDKIKIRLGNYAKYNGKGIILLDPEGRYYVRKINEKTKSLIDERRPYNPSAKEILNSLDVMAHKERYLGERV